MRGRVALYPPPPYRRVMSESDRANRSEESNAHLQGVGDGCGCAEVWEHLSEERAAREDGDERGVPRDGD